MTLTEKQIELLKKRKKELENYQIVGYILIPIFVIMIVFVNSIFSWIIIIITLFVFPSHWKRKKELDEINFKLAEIEK